MSLLSFIHDTIQSFPSEDLSRTRMENSGTGYNYGYLLEDKYVCAIGMDGLRRFNILIMLNMTENGITKKIPFIVHERESNPWYPSPICISTSRYLYDGCIVRDENEIKDLVERLCNGEIIERNVDDTRKILFSIYKPN